MHRRLLRLTKMLLLAGAALLQPLGPGGALPSPALPQAAAAERATGLTHLRVLPRVEVGRSRVTLLDLCDPALIGNDWRQVLAGVEIGEAPEAGGRKYIQAEQLRQYLQIFLESQGVDASRVALDIPATVVIDRRSITLTQDQIEAAYRDAVRRQCGWAPEELEIDRVVASGLPLVPAGELSVEAKSVKDGQCLGAVAMILDYVVAGETARSLRVTGRVALVREAFQARAALAKESILQAEDLEAVRIRVMDDPNRYPSRAEEIVGKQLRRSLQPGDPIENRDLIRPLAVKRGDPVTIFYELPGFRLTAKGVVKENAAIGDRVQVINATSKRGIYCLVLDEKTVAVAP